MSEEMDGIFIFDQQNDVIFTKVNDGMKKKLLQMCKQQELISADITDQDELDSNAVVQLFSPLIASQRIMFCQFDNSYTSLQLEHGLSLVFEEFLGFLLLKIGRDSIEYMQRYVGVCIMFIKHFCGPDVYLLKTFADKSLALSRILDDWSRSFAESEAMLIEGVEHLLLNHEVKRAAQKSLEQAIEHLKRDPYSQRSHAVLFARDKLIALCSSRQAQEMSVSDLIFLQLLSQQSAPADKSSPLHVDTHLVFLQGNQSGTYAGCIPVIMHVVRIDDDVTLIVLIEYGNLAVASGLFDIFFAMHKVRILQMQNDMDNLSAAYENLDHYIKQTIDAMKKVKYNSHEIDASLKRFINKWDLLRRKYSELFKNSEKDLILSIESNIPGMVEALKNLFKLICIECSTIDYGIQRVNEIAAGVEAHLSEFSEFLRVKASQNVILGSVFKDINGLVHFIHVNRGNGRVITPTIDVTKKRGAFIKKQVWKMVEKSRFYIQKGHLSMIWQDDAFYYSYFLWFEDNNGTQLKPKELPNCLSGTIVKPQVVPGVLAGEFYQWLIESCFPKNNSKIKCFELFSMYVGLTASHVLLDFNRRLVAILRDNITGFCGPGNSLT